jgi:hypothetical protein
MPNRPPGLTGLCPTYETLCRNRKSESLGWFGGWAFEGVGWFCGP